MVCHNGPLGFSGGGARMPARSVCLVTLSLSEAGPGRFGRQVSVTDIHHTIPYHIKTTSRCGIYRLRDSYDRTTCHRTIVRTIPYHTTSRPHQDVAFTDLEIVTIVLHAIVPSYASVCAKICTIYQQPRWHGMARHTTVMQDTSKHK